MDDSVWANVRRAANGVKSVPILTRGRVRCRTKPGSDPRPRTAIGEALGCIGTA